MLAVPRGDYHRAGRRPKPACSPNTHQAREQPLRN